ncbi:MAG: hypothetical protein K2X99_02470 [Gemmatimonadaceae bacterium]|nr:hypothetical protein [Gemmatimonadaceae bacterium]
MRPLLLALPLAFAGARPPMAPPTAALAALRTADSTIAQIADQRSLGDALATALASDARMPARPNGWVVGRDSVLARIRAIGEMARASAGWHTIRYGVSADGQHGFSFGFLHVTNRGTRSQWQKYMAYWAIDAGQWHMLAFKRAPVDSGTPDLTLRAPSLPTTQVAPRASDATSLASLKAAEFGFSDRAAEVGLRAAFAEKGSADAVNMGRGPAYTTGAEAIAALVSVNDPGPKSTLVWGADHAIVASSGDLGITFGIIRERGAAPDAPGFPFFTIWRRPGGKGEWKYVAE